MRKERICCCFGGKTVRAKGCISWIKCSDGILRFSKHMNPQLEIQREVVTVSGITLIPITKLDEALISSVASINSIQHSHGKNEGWRNFPSALESNFSNKSVQHERFSCKESYDVAVIGHLIAEDQSVCEAPSNVIASLQLTRVNFISALLPNAARFFWRNTSIRQSFGVHVLHLCWIFASSTLKRAKKILSALGWSTKPLMCSSDPRVRSSTPYTRQTTAATAS